TSAGCPSRSTRSSAAAISATARCASGARSRAWTDRSEAGAQEHGRAVELVGETAGPFRLRGVDAVIDGTIHHAKRDVLDDLIGRLGLEIEEAAVVIADLELEPVDVAAEDEAGRDFEIAVEAQRGQRREKRRPTRFARR